MFDDDRRDNNRVEQRDAEEEVTPNIKGIPNFQNMSPLMNVS